MLIDFILVNGIVCQNRVLPPPPAGVTPANHFVCEYKTMKDYMDANPDKEHRGRFSVLTRADTQNRPL